MNSNPKQLQRDDTVDNKIITDKSVIESQEKAFKASFKRSCPNTVPVEIAVKEDVMKAIGGSVGPFVAYDSILSFFERHGISIIKHGNGDVFITYKLKRGFDVSYFENLPSMNTEHRKIFFSALLSLGYEVNEYQLDDMEQQILEGMDDSEEWKETLQCINEIRDLKRIIYDEFYTMEEWPRLRKAILDLKEALGQDKVSDYCIYPDYSGTPPGIIYHEAFDYLSENIESMFDNEIVLIDNGFGVIITANNYDLYNTILRTERVHALMNKISDLLWEN